MTSEVSAKRAKFYHTEHAFHRYLLLREKRILTDGVIISSDGKRYIMPESYRQKKIVHTFTN